MRKEIMTCDRCNSEINFISSGYYEESEEGNIKEIERMSINCKELDREQRKLNLKYYDLCKECSKKFNEFMSGKEI